MKPLKRIIEFHQAKIKNSQRDKEFHRGAVMAFSKCEEQIKILLEEYNELIMGVKCKFANETRHETALRFIKNAQPESSIDPDYCRCGSDICWQRSAGVQ